MKSATIVLVAALAVLALGLTIMPAHNAAALIARQPGGINLNAGPLGIHVGQDGIGINLGSNPRPMS